MAALSFQTYVLSPRPSTAADGRRSSAIHSHVAHSAPILLANFLTGGSRWWRFTAIPGMWLGLTIVLSAMYGVSANYDTRLR